MEDKLNVPLEDAELLAEVELTTNLIIAASEADDVLTQEQIDALLGVTSAPAETGATTEGDAPHPDIPTQHRRSD